MSATVTTRGILELLVDAIGLHELVPNGAEIERGLAEIEVALARVGAEALDAEARGIPLSQAWKDDAEFPKLHRMHVGVRDIFTMELPPEVAAWARRLLMKTDDAVPNELQFMLGRMATAGELPLATRSAARVLLFQALRVALLLVEHVPSHTTPLTAGLPIGVERDDVDRIAEQELRWWLTAATELDGEIRPLNVLFACALGQLERHAAEIRAVLAVVSTDVHNELSRRHELDRLLSDMDAGDALLIRNCIASSIGEQRQSVERLQRTHSLVFGDSSRNTLDQRLSRLKKELVAGRLPERDAPALIDIINEAVEKEHSS